MRRWFPLLIIALLLLVGYAGYRSLTNDRLAGLYDLNPTRVQGKCVETDPNKSGVRTRTFIFKGKAAYASLAYLKRVLTKAAGWRLRLSDYNYALFTNSTNPSGSNVDWYLTDDSSGRSMIHEYAPISGIQVPFFKLIGKMKPYAPRPAYRYSYPIPASASSPRSRADDDLYGACQSDNLVAAESAVGRGATINPSSDYNPTPLDWAIERDSYRVAAYLIGHGAIVNVPDGIGMTALDRLGWSGDPDAIKFLHDHGAAFGKSDQSGLFSPAQIQSPVEFLTGDFADTALEDGCWMDDKEWKKSGDVAEAMLACGADPNILDHYRRHPIFYAAMHGNARVASALLKHGAQELNRKDGYGDTPLSICIKRKANEWKQVVTLLKNAGAK